MLQVTFYLFILFYFFKFMYILIFSLLYILFFLEEFIHSAWNIFWVLSAVISAFNILKFVLCYYIPLFDSKGN